MAPYLVTRAIFRTRVNLAIVGFVLDTRLMSAFLVVQPARTTPWVDWFRSTWSVLRSGLPLYVFTGTLSATTSSNYRV